MREWKRITGLATVMAFFYVNVAYPAMESASEFWRNRRAAAEKMYQSREPAEDSRPARVSAPEGSTTLLAQLPSIDLNVLTNAVPQPQLTGQTFNLGDLTSDLKTPSPTPVAVPGNLPKWVKAVPANYANLKDLYIPQGWKPGDLMVVHIQDAHGNPEAQTNIARIIEKIGSGPQKGMVVGIEGARGSFNFKPYRGFPDKKITREIAQYFLKESYITGPEYAGMTMGLTEKPSNNPAEETEPDGSILPASSNNLNNPNSSSRAEAMPLFWGIETEQLYLSHVQAFKDSITQQKEAEAQQAKLMKQLEAVKQKRLNGTLRELDEKINLHLKGQIGLGAYLKFLSQKAQGNGNLPGMAKVGPIAVGPELGKFMDALKLEEQLNYDLVERERRELTRELSQKLPKNELKNLVNASLSYRLGNLSHGAFYRYLKDLCSAYGMKLNQWGEMDKYIRYVLLSEKLNAESLFKEIEGLEKKILKANIRTDEEKAVVELSQDMTLMDKLIHYGLSPQEWERYETRRQQIRELPKRIAALNASMEPGNLSVLATAQMGEESETDGFFQLMESFEGFNQAAIQRNDALIGNLMTKVTEEEKKERGLDDGDHVAILVAGGFHTEGMMKLLKERKVAYAVLMPRLGKVEGSGTEYLDVFHRDKTPLEKLFTGERITIAPQGAMPSSPMGEVWTKAAVVAGLSIALYMGLMGADFMATYADSASIQGALQQLADVIQTNFSGTEVVKGVTAELTGTEGNVMSVAISMIGIENARSRLNVRATGIKNSNAAGLPGLTKVTIGGTVITVTPGEAGQVQRLVDAGRAGVGKAIAGIKNFIQEKRGFPAKQGATAGAQQPGPSRGSSSLLDRISRRLSDLLSRPVPADSRLGNFDSWIRTLNASDFAVPGVIGVGTERNPGMARNIADFVRRSRSQIDSVEALGRIPGVGAVRLQALHQILEARYERERADLIRQQEQFNLGVRTAGVRRRGEDAKPGIFFNDVRGIDERGKVISENVAQELVEFIRNTPEPIRNFNDLLEVAGVGPVRAALLQAKLAPAIRQEGERLQNDVLAQATIRAAESSLSLQTLIESGQSKAIPLLSAAVLAISASSLVAQTLGLLGLSGSFTIDAMSIAVSLISLAIETGRFVLNFGQGLGAIGMDIFWGLTSAVIAALGTIGGILADVPSQFQTLPSLSAVLWTVGVASLGSIMGYSLIHSASRPAAMRSVTRRGNAITRRGNAITRRRFIEVGARAGAGVVAAVGLGGLVVTPDAPGAAARSILLGNARKQAASIAAEDEALSLTQARAGRDALIGSQGKSLSDSTAKEAAARFTAEREAEVRDAQYQDEVRAAVRQANASVDHARAKFNEARTAVRTADEAVQNAANAVESAHDALSQIEEAFKFAEVVAAELDSPIDATEELIQKIIPLREAQRTKISEAEDLLLTAIKDREEAMKELNLTKNTFSTAQQQGESAKDETKGWKDREDFARSAQDNARLAEISAARLTLNAKDVTNAAKSIVDMLSNSADASAAARQAAGEIRAVVDNEKSLETKRERARQALSEAAKAGIFTETQGKAWAELLTKSGEIGDLFPLLQEIHNGMQAEKMQINVVSLYNPFGNAAEDPINQSGSKTPAGDPAVYTGGSINPLLARSPDGLRYILRPFGQVAMNTTRHISMALWGSKVKGGWMRIPGKIKHNGKVVTFQPAGVEDSNEESYYVFFAVKDSGGGLSVNQIDVQAGTADPNSLTPDTKPFSLVRNLFRYVSNQNYFGVGDQILAFNRTPGGFMPVYSYVVDKSLIPGGSMMWLFDRMDPMLTSLINRIVNPVLMFLFGFQTNAYDFYRTVVAAPAEYVINLVPSFLASGALSAVIFAVTGDAQVAMDAAKFGGWISFVALHLIPSLKDGRVNWANFAASLAIAAVSLSLGISADSIDSIAVHTTVNLVLGFLPASLSALMAAVRPAVQSALHQFGDAAVPFRLNPARSAATISLFAALQGPAFLINLRNETELKIASALGWISDKKVSFTISLLLLQQMLPRPGRPRMSLRSTLAMLTFVFALNNAALLISPNAPVAHAAPATAPLSATAAASANYLVVLKDGELRIIPPKTQMSGRELNACSAYTFAAAYGLITGEDMDWSTAWDLINNWGSRNGRGPAMLNDDFGLGGTTAELVQALNDNLHLSQNGYETKSYSNIDASVVEALLKAGHVVMLNSRNWGPQGHFAMALKFEDGVIKFYRTALDSQMSPAVFNSKNFNGGVVIVPPAKKAEILKKNSEGIAAQLAPAQAGVERLSKITVELSELSSQRNRITGELSELVTGNTIFEAKYASLLREMNEITVKINGLREESSSILASVEAAASGNFKDVVTLLKQSLGQDHHALRNAGKNYAGEKGLNDDAGWETLKDAIAEVEGLIEGLEGIGSQISRTKETLNDIDQELAKAEQSLAIWKQRADYLETIQPVADLQDQIAGETSNVYNLQLRVNLIASRISNLGGSDLVAAAKELDALKSRIGDQQNQLEALADEYTKTVQQVAAAGETPIGLQNLIEFYIGDGGILNDRLTRLNAKNRSLEKSTQEMISLVNVLQQQAQLTQRVESIRGEALAQGARVSEPAESVPALVKLRTELKEVESLLAGSDAQVESSARPIAEEGHPFAASASSLRAQSDASRQSAATQISQTVLTIESLINYLSDVEVLQNLGASQAEAAEALDLAGQESRANIWKMIRESEIWESGDRRIKATVLRGYAQAVGDQQGRVGKSLEELKDHLRRSEQTLNLGSDYDLLLSLPAVEDLGVEPMNVQMEMFPMGPKRAAALWVGLVAAVLTLGALARKAFFAIRGKRSSEEPASQEESLPAAPASEAVPAEQPLAVVSPADGGVSAEPGLTISEELFNRYSDWIADALISMRGDAGIDSTEQFTRIFDAIAADPSVMDALDRIPAWARGAFLGMSGALAERERLRAPSEAPAEISRSLSAALSQVGGELPENYRSLFLQMYGALAAQHGLNIPAAAVASLAEKIKNMYELGLDPRGTFLQYNSQTLSFRVGLARAAGAGSVTTYTVARKNLEKVVDRAKSAAASVLSESSADAWDAILFLLASEKDFGAREAGLFAEINALREQGVEVSEAQVASNEIARALLFASYIGKIPASSGIPKQDRERLNKWKTAFVQLSAKWAAEQRRAFNSGTRRQTKPMTLVEFLNKQPQGRLSREEAEMLKFGFLGAMRYRERQASAAQRAASQTAEARAGATKARVTPAEVSGRRGAALQLGTKARALEAEAPAAMMMWIPKTAFPALIRAFNNFKFAVAVSVLFGGIVFAAAWIFVSAGIASAIAVAVIPFALYAIRLGFIGAANFLEDHKTDSKYRQIAPWVENYLSLAAGAVIASPFALALYYWGVGDINTFSALGYLAAWPFFKWAHRGESTPDINRTVASSFASSMMLVAAPIFIALWVFQLSLLVTIAAVPLLALFSVYAHFDINDRWSGLQAVRQTRLRRLNVMSRAAAFIAVPLVALSVLVMSTIDQGSLPLTQNPKSRSETISAGIRDASLNFGINRKVPDSTIAYEIVFHGLWEEFVEHVAAKLGLLAFMDPSIGPSQTRLSNAIRLIREGKIPSEVLGRAKLTPKASDKQIAKALVSDDYFSAYVGVAMIDSLFEEASGKGVNVNGSSNIVSGVIFALYKIGNDIGTPEEISDLINIASLHYFKGRSAGVSANVMVKGLPYALKGLGLTGKQELFVEYIIVGADLYGSLAQEPDGAIIYAAFTGHSLTPAASAAELPDTPQRKSALNAVMAAAGIGLIGGILAGLLGLPGHLDLSALGLALPLNPIGIFLGGFFHASQMADILKAENAKRRGDLDAKAVEGQLIPEIAGLLRDGQIVPMAGREGGRFNVVPAQTRNGKIEMDKQLMARLSPSRQREILAHELTHLRLNGKVPGFLEEFLVSAMDLVMKLPASVHNVPAVANFLSRLGFQRALLDGIARTESARLLHKDVLEALARAGVDPAELLPVEQTSLSENFDYYRAVSAGAGAEQARYSLRQARFVAIAQMFVHVQGIPAAERAAFDARLVGFLNADQITRAEFVEGAQRFIEETAAMNAESQNDYAESAVGALGRMDDARFGTRTILDVSRTSGLKEAMRTIQQAFRAGAQKISDLFDPRNLPKNYVGVVDLTETPAQNLAELEKILVEASGSENATTMLVPVLVGADVDTADMAAQVRGNLEGRSDLTPERQATAIQILEQRTGLYNRALRVTPVMKGSLIDTDRVEIQVRKVLGRFISAGAAIPLFTNSRSRFTASAETKIQFYLIGILPGIAIEVTKVAATALASIAIILKSQ